MRTVATYQQELLSRQALVFCVLLHITAAVQAFRTAPLSNFVGGVRQTAQFETGTDTLAHFWSDTTLSITGTFTVGQGKVPQLTAVSLVYNKVFFVVVRLTEDAVLNPGLLDIEIDKEPLDTSVFSKLTLEYKDGLVVVYTTTEGEPRLEVRMTSGVVSVTRAANNRHLNISFKLKPSTDLQSAKGLFAEVLQQPENHLTSSNKEQELVDNFFGNDFRFSGLVSLRKLENFDGFYSKSSSSSSRRMLQKQGNFVVSVATSQMQLGWL